MKRIVNLIMVTTLLVTAIACRDKNMGQQNQQNQQGQQGQIAGMENKQGERQVPGTNIQGNDAQNPDFGFLGTGRQINELPEGTTQGIAFDANYEDGLYTGESNNGRGIALVTIRNNGIKAIDLKRVDEQGVELSDQTLMNGTAVGSGRDSNLGRAKAEITNSMLQAQTNDIRTSYDNDPTINDWKEAVGKALQKARR